MNEKEIGRFYYGKRVLITGGLGFLGSNLAHALVERGSHVTLLDSLLPQFGGNPFNVATIKDRVAIVVDDIRNESILKTLIPEHQFIFHIAGQASHVDSLADPLLDMDINCRGTLLILEAIRHGSPKSQFIYAGTRGQYGKPNKTPVSESDAMNPTDIYGIHKTTGENYLFLYSKLYGIQGISLRVNNTYGPRHQMKHGNYGILNWFIRLAMEGKPIPVFGDGNQLRDYNYVDDVTEAFLLAGMNTKSVAEPFNLGSGHPVTFLDLCKSVVRIVGQGKIDQVPWPKERATIETGDYIANFSKLRDTTGWEPKITLDDGLMRTVTFFEKYRDHYWSP